MSLSFSTLRPACLAAALTLAGPWMGARILDFTSRILAALPGGGN